MFSFFKKNIKTAIANYVISDYPELVIIKSILDFLKNNSKKVQKKIIHSSISLQLTVVALN